MLSLRQQFETYGCTHAAVEDSGLPYATTALGRHPPTLLIEHGLMCDENIRLVPSERTLALTGECAASEG